MVIPKIIGSKIVMCKKYENNSFHNYIIGCINNGAFDGSLAGAAQ